MLDVKPWYQSRTIWASIVTVSLALASTAGVPVDGVDQGRLVDLILQGGAIVSGLGALYGRVVATSRIGG